MNCKKNIWISCSCLCFLFSLFSSSTYGQLTPVQIKAFASAGGFKIEVNQEDDVKLDNDYFLQIAKACIYTAGLEIRDGEPIDNDLMLTINSKISLLEVKSNIGVYYNGAKIRGVMHFKDRHGAEFQREFKNIYTLNNKKDSWSPQKTVYLDKSYIPYYNLFMGTESYLDVLLKSMYEIYGENFLFKCMLVDTMDHFSEGRIFSSNTLKYEFKTFAANIFGETRNAASIPILINELNKFNELKSSTIIYDERDYYYAVIRALGEIGDTSAIVPLVLLLEYSDANNLNKTILNIRTALINIGNPAIEHLKQNLTTSSAGFQFELLVILANLEDRTIRDQLLPYLKNTNRYKQETAIEALVASNDTSVITSIINLHQQIRNLATTLALVTLYKKSDSLSISQSIQTKIIKSIAQNLSDEDVFLTNKTIPILEEVGNEEAAKALLKFIENSGNIYLKKDAVDALYSIIKNSNLPISDQDLQTRIVKTISQNLTDENFYLTQNAIYILKELKDYKAAKALVDFLGKSGNANLKRYTVEALYAITGENYGYNLKKWNKWLIRYNEE
jgi:HEAT repeat protein